jgi:uncharacterized protein YifN (PemK superfamily)
MCDFTTGFKPPEMVKRRHVVVVSPRYRRHTGLCLVVPFSTVAPRDVEPHHLEILPGTYDFLDPTKSTWAKADMLTCVCFDRLDRLILYGRYVAPPLKDKHLSEIQRCVAHALQLHLDCAAAITYTLRVPDKSGLIIFERPAGNGGAFLRLYRSAQHKHRSLWLAARCLIMNETMSGYE